MNAKSPARQRRALHLTEHSGSKERPIHVEYHTITLHHQLEAAETQKGSFEMNVTPITPGLEPEVARSEMKECLSCSGIDGDLVRGELKNPDGTVEAYWVHPECELMFHPVLMDQVARALHRHGWKIVSRENDGAEWRIVFQKPDDPPWCAKDPTWWDDPNFGETIIHQRPRPAPSLRVIDGAPAPGSDDA
jgi:hypothetical protein